MAAAFELLVHITGWMMGSVTDMGQSQWKRTRFEGRFVSVVLHMLYLR